MERRADEAGIGDSYRGLHRFVNRLCLSVALNLHCFRGGLGEYPQETQKSPNLRRIFAPTLVFCDISGTTLKKPDFAATFYIERVERSMRAGTVRVNL